MITHFKVLKNSSLMSGRILSSPNPAALSSEWLCVPFMTMKQGYFSLNCEPADWFCGQVNFKYTPEKKLKTLSCVFCAIPRSLKGHLYSNLWLSG